MIPAKTLTSAIRNYFFTGVALGKVRAELTELDGQDKADLAAGFCSAGLLTEEARDDVFAKVDAVPHPSYAK